MEKIKMNKMPLISKAEMSGLITGPEFINKLARISYFTNLSFKQLEDTTLEYNDDTIYLVHTDVMITKKPIHKEIAADIETLLAITNINKELGNE